MAQRRMFNKSITNSDSFMEMPSSSQNLYFHLSMNADDDGFVDNWKAIMRMTGTKDDDLKVLIAKSYIIPFESGVIVIKHWRLNNYLQADRKLATIHQEEFKKLNISKNGQYFLKSVENKELNKICIHSIEKNSIEENSINNKKYYGEFNNVNLSDDEYAKLEKSNLLPYIEKLSSYIASKGKKYKSHYATILTWARKDKKLENTPEWFDKDIKQEILSKKEENEIKELFKDYK